MTEQMIKYLDSYNGIQGYFLKIFFINPKKNENGWKVTPASIAPGLATALDTNRFGGKTAPLIKRQDYAQPDKLGHPDPMVPNMIEIQEPDRVSDTVAVGNDEKRGWVIVHVTDYNTEMGFRSGKFKFVSPSIESVYTNEKGEDESWRVNHLAIVDDPAYGYDAAQITHSCSGTGVQCVTQLAKQASKNKKLLHRKDMPLITRQTMQETKLVNLKDIPLSN